MIIEDENLENVNGGEGVVFSTDCCGDYLPKQSGEDILEKNCYSCYYFETRRRPVVHSVDITPHFLGYCTKSNQ